MGELKSEKLFQELHAEIGATGFMGAQARLAGYRAQVIAEKQELLDQRDTSAANEKQAEGADQGGEVKTRTAS